MMQHKIVIFENSQLAALQNKALFLIGEYDRFSNYAKAIAKLDVNKLLYKIIRDAGHAINHEQAEMINKEIVNFLEWELRSLCEPRKLQSFCIIEHEFV